MLRNNGTAMAVLAAPLPAALGGGVVEKHYRWTKG